MEREQATHIISEYLKPIFGFTLKRCKNDQDAEDLCQEIILKVFRALIIRDDIEEPGKFIWSAAHNALANYYRDNAKYLIGISLNELSDCDEPYWTMSDDECADTIKRLQSEIAYLSKLRRQIVISYYFENKKQNNIAYELGIPLGTVKWHLFEAKKELKRGMVKMRKPSQLKFNPVKFNLIGINGSAGTKAVGEILRSALSQNICYDVRDEAKPADLIADDLGVSPVYVESEIENLEEYGLLKKQTGGYIVNFLLTEQTPEFLNVRDLTYKKAANLFAPALFDELTESGIADDPAVMCHQSDTPIELNRTSRADRNFVLWSLIPFIIASSGKKDSVRIKFEEVASLRPDGGYNIFKANVENNGISFPDDNMKNLCGPAVYSNEGYSLWRMDTEWSGRRITVDSSDHERMMRIIGDYVKFWSEDGVDVGKSEFAWLSELGFVKTCGDYDGCFKSCWQVVELRTKEIRDKMIALGNRVRERFESDFEGIKAAYIKAALETVPRHMRRAEEYELQFVFSRDSMFIRYCIKTLLDEGKLKLPTEEQKKAMSTIIYLE